MTLVGPFFQNLVFVVVQGVLAVLLLLVLGVEKLLVVVAGAAGPDNLGGQVDGGLGDERAFRVLAGLLVCVRLHEARPDGPGNEAGNEKGQYDQQAQYEYGPSGSH